MANASSRTRTQPTTIDDELDAIINLLTLIKDTDGIKKITDPVDISDRWTRQLGQIDLQRYLGLPCGPANPIDVTALIPGIVNVDVTDRWARQLGQIDLARVLGAALTPANPVITGIYDALGNRMPSMDAVARAGYVDVIDRAARLLGTVSPVAGSVWDVSDRWARQLGLVDLSRVLGAALSAANPVVIGLYDAAGNRMPSMDNAIRPGYIDVIDRAARLLGVVYGSQAQQLLQRAATFDLLVQLRSAGVEIDPRQIRSLTAATDVVATTDNGGSLTIDNSNIDNRTVTKHDAKTYLWTAAGSAVDGATVIAAVANKVIKIHRLFLQSTVDGATDVYLYEETSGNLVTTNTTLNAREGRESAFVPAPACIGQTTTVNKAVLLKNAATKQVYWEITYSADDAV